MDQRIAFIGFGEAGSAVVSGWKDVPDIRVFDIKTDYEAQRPAMLSRYQEFGVAGRMSAAEAVQNADLVFCTVTADQAAIAAGNCAPHMKPGALWLDLNSCAPSTKKSAAETVEAAGARYVDVAVMAPVYPKRNMVPLLLAGPHAETVKPLLEALPMSPRVVEGPVGSASSIKMIRSIMMKGMEALTAECVLAAVRAGVDEEVLASLQASNPEIDWKARSSYNFERSLQHGIRRAAEMREVVKTVSDLGFAPDMASATVEWQDRMGGLGLGAEVSEELDYREIAAKITQRMMAGN
ncbi:DUF1932 domain-containing protein [Nisaea acidiphila]|uniref:DUF1932 domain-containing protein n=1 Tax=Nisaea acidiphila TaxID=1862145 RepID=A0A9J7ASY7_9PROT|nr:DUF1932 domain-containing protein [Nisaea acidiphila]UUX48477.1 DUF1932 domain-containing protein [Nisaea acidiphila]